MRVAVHEGNSPLQVVLPMALSVWRSLTKVAASLQQPSTAVAGLWVTTLSFCAVVVTSAL
ncbi:hypothetical protein D3C86_1761170 [compost metagenome]